MNRTGSNSAKIAKLVHLAPILATEPIYKPHKSPTERLRQLKISQKLPKMSFTRKCTKILLLMSKTGSNWAKIAKLAYIAPIFAPEPTYKPHKSPTE